MSAIVGYYQQTTCDLEDVFTGLSLAQTACGALAQMAAHPYVGKRFGRAIAAEIRRRAALGVSA
jgi:hypothetical protein